jgi:Icc-related predicted phosphoesterase
MRVTFISDTHSLHGKLTEQLPGGDIIIHSGDFMNSGYFWTEASVFLEWFNKLDNYTHKVLIAGNHDRWFEINMEEVIELLKLYPNITYLIDQSTVIDGVNIYGSPWQPEFMNWAFNLPKGGPDLMSKWEAIPMDTDILITHGPPQDHLDVSGPPWNTPHLGCALLRVKVDAQPPKIHVFGHIHGGYGYKFHNDTHFFNASVLNENYEQVNNPITIEWEPETNQIKFLES